MSIIIPIQILLGILLLIHPLHISALVIGNYTTATQQPHVTYVVSHTVARFLPSSEFNITAYPVLPDDPTLCSGDESYDFTNRIVLVERGDCSFHEKELIARKYNAMGMVVGNSDDTLVFMGAPDGVDDLSIPSILVRRSVFNFLVEGTNRSIFPTDDGDGDGDGDGGDDDGGGDDDDGGNEDGNDSTSTNTRHGRERTARLLSTGDNTQYSNRQRQQLPSQQQPKQKDDHDHTNNPIMPTFMSVLSDMIAGPEIEIPMAFSSIFSIFSKSSSSSSSSSSSLQSRHDHDQRQHLPIPVNLMLTHYFNSPHNPSQSLNEFYAAQHDNRPHRTTQDGDDEIGDTYFKLTMDSRGAVEPIEIPWAMFRFMFLTMLLLPIPWLLFILYRYFRLLWGFKCIRELTAHASNALPVCVFIRTDDNGVIVFGDPNDPDDDLYSDTHAMSGDNAGVVSSSSTTSHPIPASSTSTTTTSHHGSSSSSNDHSDDDHDHHDDSDDEKTHALLGHTTNSSRSDDANHSAHMGGKNKKQYKKLSKHQSSGNRIRSSSFDQDNDDGGGAGDHINAPVSPTGPSPLVSTSMADIARYRQRYVISPDDVMYERLRIYPTVSANPVRSYLVNHHHMDPSTASLLGSVNHADTLSLSPSSQSSTNRHDQQQHQSINDTTPFNQSVPFRQPTIYLTFDSDISSSSSSSSSLTNNPAIADLFDAPPSPPPPRSEMYTAITPMTTGPSPPRANTTHLQIHNDVCSICLDVFVTGDDVKILPCLHGYHAACIDQWFTARRQGSNSNTIRGSENALDGRNINNDDNRTLAELIGIRNEDANEAENNRLEREQRNAFISMYLATNYDFDELRDDDDDDDDDDGNNNNVRAGSNNNANGVANNNNNNNVRARPQYSFTFADDNASDGSINNDPGRSGGRQAGGNNNDDWFQREQERQFNDIQPSTFGIGGGDSTGQRTSSQCCPVCKRSIIQRSTRRRMARKKWWIRLFECMCLWPCCGATGSWLSCCCFCFTGRQSARQRRRERIAQQPIVIEVDRSDNNNNNNNGYYNQPYNASLYAYSPNIYQQLPPERQQQEQQQPSQSPRPHATLNTNGQENIFGFGPYPDANRANPSSPPP